MEWTLDESTWMGKWIKEWTLMRTTWHKRGPLVSWIADTSGET
jgi:hypothetical protein